LGKESSMAGGRTTGGGKMDPEQVTGMRMGEKVAEHGKGGMEMRKDL
jgi:hypothetical protein